MRKALFSMVGILAALLMPILLLAPIASAQTTRIHGTVLDLQGNPYAGVAITVTNKADGSKYTTTTDKNGKFAVNGLKDGIYDINFKKDNINYTEEVQTTSQTADNGLALNMNFKEIAEKDPAYMAAMEKAKAANAKFKQMKVHFDNGVHAMQSAASVKQQIQTTTDPTQRQTLQASLSNDYQTAITEFQQAQQGAPPKDPNLPTILGNLAIAYEGAGQYDKAVAAAQQAAAIKPTPAIYQQLGTDLAYQGKMDEASAACEKAASLDPTNKDAAEICYKNMGIVLTNAGKMSDAATPLQKASQLNPNDAEVWYLLGNALAAQINVKQEGGKDVYIIPPGTKAAYKKYLKLDPNGVHAAEVKQTLATLEGSSSGKSQ